MTDYKNLYDAIIDFIDDRFDGDNECGAAGAILEDGEIVFSTAPDYYNNGVNLCHETGALLESYNRNLRVQAIMCLYKDEEGEIIVLSPCGICQERLRDHQIMGEGDDQFMAAVPSKDGSKPFEMKSFAELSPYDWTKPFQEMA